MAKLSINTDTGLREIEITRNGKHVGNIYFSPSDPSIIKRLRKAGEKIQEITLNIDEEADFEAQLAEADRIDNELRQLVDYAFDYPCSEVVFGNSYSFTPHKGVSAIEQFLTAAIDIISAEIDAEADASKARQDKYLSKYRK